jgi:hypothetical protein
MRSASLPVVDHLSTLDDAWQTMRKAKRSGVIVRKGRSFRLYTASELASARNQGSSQKLHNLAGSPIHVPTLLLSRRSASSRNQLTDLLLNSLKKSRKKYGLLSTASGGGKKAVIYGLPDSLYDVSVAYVEPGPRDK